MPLKFSELNIIILLFLDLINVKLTHVIFITEFVTMKDKMMISCLMSHEIFMTNLNIIIKNK